MGFSSVPHILRVGDVLPAEGVQKVVDVANGSRTALHVQHDFVFHGHFDAPFPIAVVLLKPEAGHGVSVVKHQGPIRRVWEDTNTPLPGTNYVIELAGVFVDGAHASVRYANAAITLREVAPTCVPEEGGRNVRVLFGETISPNDVNYVHVLIRGVAA